MPSRGSPSCPCELTVGVMRSLVSGWWCAVATIGDRVLLCIQFDPNDQMPEHGVKRVVMSVVEVDQLVSDLRAAQAKAGGGGS